MDTDTLIAELATAPDLASVLAIGRKLDSHKATLGTGYATVKAHYYDMRARHGGKPVPEDLGVEVIAAPVKEPAARLIENMPAATYHADPAPAPSLSSGIAELLLTSQRKAWLAHPRLNKNYRERDRSRFDLGTSAHAMLLEGDSKNIVVVDADDWRTKKAQEARLEAHAEGKTALRAEDFDSVKGMVDAALVFIAQSELADVWAAGKRETTILWREDDVWLRCRPDWLLSNLTLSTDYKTTTDASPEVFTRQIVSMGYHFQDAFYRRGIRALGGSDPKFLFLAQETEAPYECALYGCDPTLREIAEAKVEQAIGLWRECLKSGEWKGYGGRVHWAAAPTWLRMEHEEGVLNGV